MQILLFSREKKILVLIVFEISVGRLTVYNRLVGPPYIFVLLKTATTTLK